MSAPNRRRCGAGRSRALSYLFSLNVPGVNHGLRAKHLQSYLDEFVFRFNRRRTRHAAFRSLLGLASNAKPVTYKMLIAPELQG